MFSVFTNREFRNRLLLTAAMLAIFRVGYWLQLPGVEGGDRAVGSWSDFAAMLAASDLSSGAVFGLGIMPYISASIVFQLLGQVIPSLQAFQKDGEQGRRKLNEYTRYATVALAFGQSLFWIGVIKPNVGMIDQVLLSLVMSCGTMILLWIGEQIDAYGIGSGVSLLIMGGIVSRLPSSLFAGVAPAIEDGVRIGTATGLEVYLAQILVVALVLAGVVVLGEAHRRINVVAVKDGARKGQFIPLKLNQAGVMPVIFASSVLLIPAALFEYLNKAFDLSYGYVILGLLGDGNVGGIIIRFAVIMFFTFFWTAVTFRPAEIAESMKDAGVFVPGFRPGGRTEAYLERVMARLALVNGVALAVVSSLPSVGIGALGMVGGTGLMIVVSVALDVRGRIQSYQR